jgi:hypothetical protein
MPSKASEEAIQADVTKLISCTLNDIRVGVFHADFVFLGDTLTIIVRINKKFEFSLEKADGMAFDPTLQAPDPLIESSKFVFLRGMRCRHAALDRTKFEMAFDGNARLWIELGARDFEPLHLIGSSGERHEKLDFYHVL